MSKLVTWSTLFESNSLMGNIATTAVIIYKKSFLITTQWSDTQKFYLIYKNKSLYAYNGTSHMIHLPIRKHLLFID